MSEKNKIKSLTARSSQHSLGKLVYDSVTPSPAPTDPKTILFLEWCDDDINLTTFVATPGSHSGKGKDKRERSDDFTSFEDPQVLFLPFCFQEIEFDWKRARDIFPEHQLVIFTNTNDYPDLLSPSSHLLNSAFMRSFISSITIVEYLSNTTKFQTEATTLKYVPNAHGPWKPWHHIYSGGKAGRGTTHNPQINKVGKYDVRLFWMGTWRRVIIDDFLPVDKSDHVLLPSLKIPHVSKTLSIASEKSSIVHTAPKKPKKPVKDKGSKKSKKSKKSDKSAKEPDKPKLEIWPFLLSKALLKLANLTMKKDKDLVHFNIIHCLTGWVLQDIDVRGVCADEMWDICKTYTKLFSWDKPEEPKIEPKPKKREKKGKKKKKKVLRPSNPEVKQSHYFIALCRDMRSLKSTTVEGISPCWGHEIIIDECRDIPIEKPAPNEEYPLWKTFRWIEWAKSKNFISEPTVLDTTRYVKCVSPFKQFSKFTVFKEVPKSTLHKPQEFPLRKSIGGFLPEVVPPPLTAEKSEKSKTERTKTDSSKSKTHPPPTQIPDLSMWVKFDDLCHYLIKFCIFFKASEFEHKARVSDLELAPIVHVDTTVKKKTPTKVIAGNDNSLPSILYPKVIQERKNVPLYFFTDSLDTKMILVNLSQAGEVERLLPLEDYLSEDNFFSDYERVFGEKNRMNLDTSVPPKKMKLNRPKIHAGLKTSTLLFDRYIWDCVETGAVDLFVNTYGDKSTLVELESGRHIFKVWIKSEFSFCVTVLADTPFTIGGFEQILDKMAAEPMQITQLSLDIASCFVGLINTFGTDNFSESLRKYYQSYMPTNSNSLSKHQKSLIHSAFRTSMLYYLEQTQDLYTLNRSIDALRTLFLDTTVHATRPNVSHISISKTENVFQFQSFQEKLICEKASTKLSAFFKRIQIMLLKKRHQSDTEGHSNIIESLKIIYIDIFATENHNDSLGTVLRNFFHDPAMEDLLSCYDMSKDFRWDILVQTFTGSSELTRDCAILCRFNIYCLSEVIICIHLFCNISNHVIRIINNDTGDEVYRFTNEVFPLTYMPNKFGYTVVGFAWSEYAKVVSWKLVVLSTRKTVEQFLIENTRITTQNSFDHYIPICNALIGKHSIVARENVILTLRFSCSSKDVNFNIKLFDPEQNLIIDLYGTERIILPAVLLKYENHSEMMIAMDRKSSKGLLKSKSTAKYSIFEVHKKSTEKGIPKKNSISMRKVKESMEASIDSERTAYSMEIYVLDNSWPLTMSEWKTVKNLRESYYFYNVQNKKEGILPIKGSWSRHGVKSTKESRKGGMKRIEAIDPPWYLLQYVFEANVHAAIVKDKKEEDDIYSLKKSWYDADPGRYERSIELREAYLAKYTDRGCECPDEFYYGSLTESSIEDHSTSQDTSYTTTTLQDDDEIMKMTKCPRWGHADIPPFDLSPYYRPQCPCPLDIRRKYIKTEEDHEADRQERNTMIQEYNDTIDRQKNDLELWIDESMGRFTFVTYWYSDCRNASERVMQDYYKLRQNYIDKRHEALVQPIPLKKPKKKEKTKKKKTK